MLAQRDRIVVILGRNLNRKLYPTLATRTTMAQNIEQKTIVAGSRSDYFES